MFTPERVVAKLTNEELKLYLASQVRAISAADFVPALRQVKASVSEKDLDLYIDWDRKFGATK